MPPEDRIATFDQDGTLWVEHPMYTQVMFASIACLRWSEAAGVGIAEPFKTVLADDMRGDRRLSEQDLEEIIVVTHAGMTVDDFQADRRKWLRQRSTRASSAPIPS